MKTRTWFGVLASVVVLVVAGSSPAGWLDSMRGQDLDSLLAKQLGMTDDQTKGGIGAMLGLAKEKLKAGDYDTLVSAVPGADKYLNKAKKMGLLDSPIENKNGLSNALSKLGISKEQKEQFVPVLTDMIGKAGGDQVKSVLSSFLG